MLDNLNRVLVRRWGRLGRYGDRACLRRLLRRDPLRQLLNVRVQLPQAQLRDIAIEIPKVDRNKRLISELLRAVGLQKEHQQPVRVFDLEQRFTVDKDLLPLVQHRATHSLMSPTDSLVLKGARSSFLSFRKPLAVGRIRLDPFVVGISADFHECSRKPHLTASREALEEAILRLLSASFD